MNYINTTNGQYPVTLFAIRQANPNMSIPSDPDDDLLEDLGYAKVHPSVKPEADVVEEQAPELDVDGKYIQVFVGRPYNAVELAQRANSVREQKFNDGMPWIFPDGVEGHVQIRAQDQVNLLALKSRAQDYIDSPEPPTFQFRSQEDTQHALTPAQAVEMCNAAFDYCYQIMAESWVVKDAAIE